MPELRKDPIIGRWVIISTERAKRPIDFKKEKKVTKKGFCPFCEGNESATPPEILAYRPKGDKNTPNWKIRVVPNKFPALAIESEFIKRGLGLYDMMGGFGAHEVIIESPHHEDTLSNLSLKQFEDIFWAFRDRIMDLKKDERFKYILIFKNQGEEAGASLEHTHSQLIGLPIIPILVNEELKGAREYYNSKERCIYCDIIYQEIKENVRIVDENEDIIAISPYAPKAPFETWILPKEHSPNFENCRKSIYESLAVIFRNTLKRLDIALDVPPYNFILHNSPLYGKTWPYYHWHFEIMPKLTKVAGFEWGSGFYINPVPPEDATRYLREISLDTNNTI